MYMIVKQASEKWGKMKKLVLK